MSDHIPFEIQSEIMKRLPVKSLLQFRSVSKHWKSFIDSPKFIKEYHINHTNPQHHLLVKYELDDVQIYTSIIDDASFPHQKFPLTTPKTLRLLKKTVALSSVDGLLGFIGCFGDSKIGMVVLWNPTVRKSVGIVVNPKAGYESTIVGFGVCLDTSDPKLVMISVATIPNMWDVEVFTLSTRTWKTVFTGAPLKSCCLSFDQVSVNGVIYFRADGHGVRSNIVISFDLKSEKFGEVCLPERLVHATILQVTKVNESLGVFEYYIDGEMLLCGVWSKKDGNKPFTKIYTIELEGRWSHSMVLGFRNNGEALMEVRDDNNFEEHGIEVYEPLPGHTNRAGINGKPNTFSTRSYMETLLLLDESASIIL